MRNAQNLSLIQLPDAGGGFVYKLAEHEKQS